MASVHSKELLGWYLITLKLRQTLESRLSKKSTIEPRPPESEWVVSIKVKLEQARQDKISRGKLSIYRFPRHLKDGDDKDWVPQIVSLGPYHHGKEGLHHMERHKWRCLHRILERSHQEIGRYLDSVKEVEERARACYEGTISMSSDEFVEMMVLDGCLVIELFRGFNEGFGKLGYPRDDPVFSMRPSMLEIRRDMIMLENQIPLFILDRLLDLQLDDTNQKGGVAKLAVQFFDPLMRNDRLEFNPLFDFGRVHSLEVFWRSLNFLGPKRSKTKQWSECRGKFTPGLTALGEAGVKIRRNCERWWGDIRFEDGILWIPRLEIHEGTRSLFLNLIALEQSHLDCSNFVTSYVIFMHNLISSPEDVRYLRDHRIIKHCLGSDADVADLFKRLCRDVAFNIRDSHLHALSSKLRKYNAFGFIPGRIDSWIAFIKVIYMFRVGSSLARKWRAWRTILRNKYFDSPWSIISLIAGFVLLVLTFIQALYAVYSYNGRPS